MNASSNITLKKSVVTPKPKVKLSSRIILNRAVIITRNCADREFAVRARNGANYRVLFVRINGQSSTGSRSQFNLCQQNAQGFQPGDRITVSGQYQLRNGQKYIYNAALSR